ncbi:MAG: hypothetical protein JO000_07215, partial [Alphaproteobacteria bacterium]|nr:hypothetical protein [Alphaproteobacteria bacterium]
MPTEPANSSDSLVFARTRGGLTLPVIDLSRPPYAEPDDPASIERLRVTFLEWLRKQQRGPRFIMKLLMRLAARRSRLARILFTSDQSYLDSITTYLLKLRPEHLPEGFNSRIDRRIVDTPHAPLLLLRMQQIAKLMATALQQALGGRPAAPLHLINIAGGPALDSINALIFLARQHAELLRRPIAIDVLDAQAEG